MSMPVQIRRNAGRNDFVPAYSTDELLHGLCHITHIPYTKPQHKGTEDRIARFMEVIDLGMQAAIEIRQVKSRAKFEENKAAICELLSKGRGLCSTARAFHIGEQALKRYLWEEQSKASGARYPYLERLRQAAREREMKEGKSK